MDELKKLIKKWDEQIALHRRVCDDPLMHTKEDRLQNSHYAQAICAVVADLKKLTIPDVVGQSEQLKASFQIGEKVLLDDNTEVEVIVAEPKLYIRQNEFDSEMWVNIERLKKKSL